MHFNTCTCITKFLNLCKHTCIVAYSTRVALKISRNCFLTCNNKQAFVNPKSLSMKNNSNIAMYIYKNWIFDTLNSSIYLLLYMYCILTLVLSKNKCMIVKVCNFLKLTASCGLTCHIIPLTCYKCTFQDVEYINVNLLVFELFELSLTAP